MYGPTVDVCEQLHSEKYRLPKESFEESIPRITYALCDDDKHSEQLKDIFLKIQNLILSRSGPKRTGKGL